jgi:hypothetical protein
VENDEDVKESVGEVDVSSCVTGVIVCDEGRRGNRKVS